MKDQIPQEQWIYWELGNYITRIDPDPETFNIFIDISIHARDLNKIYKKKINGRLFEVALIDELMFRVNKINKERIYYMQYVKKLLNFNQVTVKIQIDSTRTPREIQNVFNDTYSYDDFWAENDDINPEHHVKGYELRYKTR